MVNSSSVIPFGQRNQVNRNSGMHNWQKVLLSPRATLREAIAFIDKSGERIALVVDEDKHLLGTITDGDIRRGLLKGCDMSDPCTKVMCASPVCAVPGTSSAKLNKLYHHHQIIHIPLVDGSGRVCGLSTLQEQVSDKPLRDNPVFIMAGGFGQRLRPLTNHCPKPMLKVGKKPILELILDGFIKAGFHRFYFSTHYMPEMIREHFGDGSRWGVTITYVHEKEPLGTGGALGLLPHEDINEPLILMNGDLLTNVNYVELLDFHHKNHSMATMCVREFEYQIPFGVIEMEGIDVTGISEKPVQKYKVNAGIYVLEPELVTTVKKDRYLDMPTLLEQSLLRGCKVSSFPVHEYWLDIGRKEDFATAQSQVSHLSEGRAL